jgi:hypothetical protein
LSGAGSGQYDGRSKCATANAGSTKNRADSVTPRTTANRQERCLSGFWSSTRRPSSPADWHLPEPPAARDSNTPWQTTAHTGSSNQGDCVRLVATGEKKQPSWVRRWCPRSSWSGPSAPRSAASTRRALVSYVPSLARLGRRWRTPSRTRSGRTHGPSASRPWSRSPDHVAMLRPAEPSCSHACATRSAIATSALAPRRAGGRRACRRTRARGRASRRDGLEQLDQLDPQELRATNVPKAILAQLFPLASGVF